LGITLKKVIVKAKFSQKLASCAQEKTASSLSERTKQEVGVSLGAWARAAERNTVAGKTRQKR